ncbi:MAG: hypothetical protein RR397_04885 [Odoribacter sp.]
MERIRWRRREGDNGGEGNGGEAKENDCRVIGIGSSSLLSCKKALYLHSLYYH